MTSYPILYIGNRNYSSWSLRPWLFLHEFGVQFESEVIPLDTPEFREQVARVSPTLRVPVLVDGDVHVWDSLAICLYAIDHWIGPAAMPLDPAARAMCLSIVAEMHSGFSGLRTHCPMNIRKRRAGFALPAEAAADAARIQSLWRDARSAFGAGGPFLFGAFSLADAFFAPVVTRFLSYAVTVDEASAQYCSTVMQTAGMRAWCAAAESEPWALSATDDLVG